MSSIMIPTNAEKSGDVAAPVRATTSLQAALLAEDKLYNTGYAALRLLQCRCRDGVLSIRGAVPTFYLKQVALVAVRNTDGIDTVVDQIEVARPQT